MAILATSSCGCPITKTLTVSFTGSNPAPSNGYKVGYRKLGSTGNYTFVSPNPTTSPVVIPNVPVCEDLQVMIQSECDNSQVSSPQTQTVTAYTSQVCNAVISGNHTHNGFYAYDPYLLNVQGAASTITLTYDVVSKPNRFSVYDDNDNLVVSSGWKGVANYAGPWGATLNTATTGSISFTKAAGKCFYKLIVESVTDVSFADTFSVTFSCPNSAPVTPTITYQSCSSGAGVYRIDAPANTNIKLSLEATGTLTNNSQSYCARLEGTISSSTGPSSTQNSSSLLTTGSRTIGSSNSLFVNVTIPGTGYLVINTSVQTKNSAVGNTTATLKIFEVNGSAANITQSVCVGSTSGVVSCPVTYYEYNISATGYASCGNACDTGVTTNTTVYATVNSETLLTAQTLYADQSGTVWTGGTGNYHRISKVGNTGNGYSVQVGINGIVNDTRQCVSSGTCGSSI